MRRLFVHPQDPQPRLVRQAVQALGEGQLLILPTDACAVLVADAGRKAAVERLRRIRQLDERHLFTLLCADLSALAIYAQTDNSSYRFLKAWTPGPYTFVLTATRQVPRRLWHPSRRTVGLRVPDHPVAQAVLRAFGGPLICSSLILPGDELPLHDGDDMLERIACGSVMLLDAGHFGIVPTTVVDLSSGAPQILREGAGSVQRMLGQPG
jgi:tRNA threonylcarbamoyl adenosine modification protein (Sua5/YciO/YrdC/YwlC family)